MNRILITKRSLNCGLLSIALCIAALAGTARSRAAESVSEKVGAVASETEKAVRDAGASAKERAAELWRRIDAQRLVNRTPDQIVAWVIMGLLVGGLIQQFSKLNKVTTLLLGLAGAFIGGIIASVTGFNLDLGPVLVRYEELLASFVGGALIVLGAKLLASRKAQKK